MIHPDVWISVNDLMSYVERAFDFGQTAPADLDLEIAQEIMAEICTKMDNISKFGAVTLESLVNIFNVSGSKIFHPLLGDGEMLLTQGKVFVKFSSGKLIRLDLTEAKIWSYPLSTRVGYP